MPLPGRTPQSIANLISDPAYSLPESGRYWQITAADGDVIASRSLFDTVLAIQPAPSDRIAFQNVTGPDGELRVAVQAIHLDSGGAWTVMVGQSLATLSDERSQLRQSLIAAFLLVSMLGIGNAMLQTSAILRPIANLRRDILNRWDSAEKLNPSAYPTEVAPLVSDISALLQRNHDMFDRTRQQGADLAHALKTPSAILRNELAMLASSGNQVGVAVEALDRIDSQILRSLARLRAVNAGAMAMPQTEVKRSVERLARLFRSLPDAELKTFEFRVDQNHKVAMDHHDLEEVIGNMLENAFRWCRKQVVLTSTMSKDVVVLRLEDDGPGIADLDRPEAMRPGGRLDQQPKGTGLGLAIAHDLVAAYGGTLELGKSATLGGLSVTIALPVRSPFTKNAG